MFTTSYRCARTAARPESRPAAKSRLAYMEHLAVLFVSDTQQCVLFARHNNGILERFMDQS
jgi:hypothetical protein